MELSGFVSLKKKLVAIKRIAENVNVSAVTGYVRPYAVYVHEDLDANHAPGKTAKYLENPARQLSRVLADIVNVTYLRTYNMGQALLAACNRLKQESQVVVPVDTGALHGSAFTCMDRDLDQATQAAYERGQAIWLAAGRK